MDRSLDPRLIELALGDKQNLPSTDQVADMLSEAELALLLNRPSVPEDLINTGWYLHSIASNKYALETYGIERQRAAFSVAGHIFDLKIQSEDIEVLERYKYGFATQIAYLRSRLDPNAIAIYNRDFRGIKNDLNLRTDFSEISLSSFDCLLDSSTTSSKSLL